jgi:hypothetical protein
LFLLRTERPTHGEELDQGASNRNPAAGGGADPWPPSNPVPSRRAEDAMKETRLAPLFVRQRTIRWPLLLLALCSILLSLSASQAAVAFPSDFLGIWGNTESNPDCTLGFQIAWMDAARTQLGVRVLMACTPEPCDWGVTRLYTFGDDDTDRDHYRGWALYDLGFSRTLITFGLTSDDMGRLFIETESYASYDDGSQPYFYYEEFKLLQR